MFSFAPQTFSPAAAAGHDGSVTAGGRPLLHVGLVADLRQSFHERQSQIYFRSEVSLVGFLLCISLSLVPMCLSKLHISVFVWKNLLIVIVSVKQEKLFIFTGVIVLSLPIFVPVLLCLISGSLVIRFSSVGRPELYSSFVLENFQIQTHIFIPRPDCLVSSTLIRISSGHLLILPACCSSLNFLCNRSGKDPHKLRWTPENSSRRRTFFVRSIHGGWWGKSQNPNVIMCCCFMGCYGPTILFKVLGIVLEVVRRFMGLSCWTLIVLSCLAHPASYSNLVDKLASLLDSTSPIRESKNVSGLHPRMLSPEWETPAPQISTALKRISCGFLNAACSWSSFDNCKITLVKQLDPVEEFISLCISKNYPFISSIVMFFRLLFYWFNLWFEEANKLNLEFVFEPYY